MGFWGFGAKPGEKPVTHKTMEEAKVGCQSCHLHLIHGNAQVSGEKCLNCHDNEVTIMKEVMNKKLMHKEHVAGQAASCFNCHEPIVHKKRDFLDTARETWSTTTFLFSLMVVNSFWFSPICL